MLRSGGITEASWGGRAPLLVAATIPLTVVLTYPWLGHQLPAVPGFLAMLLAVLIACDLLTVLLLVGHYRAGGSPRLLALSWAFLWSAGAATQLAFAIPGVLDVDPTFAAAPNSVWWLWVSRNVVPPVLIALALAPWPEQVERRATERRGRSTRSLLSLAGVLAAILLFTTLVALAPAELPTITDATGARINRFGSVAMVALQLVMVGLAVAGVVRRQAGTRIEAWAVVASLAFLGDVYLTVAHPGSFTAAYYLARGLGFAAAAIVLLAILRDSHRLQEQTSVAAQRLELQNTVLLEAQRLRDHLTAVVSHDMRTPLAGLQGYLELLRDDDLDPGLGRRMLDRSWMLTRRLTLLTEDLLAAATLEHGDLVVSPQRLDLALQLGECASCFPDLDLRLDCPSGLTVRGDPLRLQQVLANLVRNAQKHGAEPVVIAAAAGRPGWVEIRVSDAGTGVPADFGAHLFERYTQGAGTANGGSGLGLSVVRDLVAAHQGTVRYESATNAFVIRLPAGDPAREADPLVTTRSDDVSARSVVPEGSTAPTVV